MRQKLGLDLRRIRPGRASGAPPPQWLEDLLGQAHLAVCGDPEQPQVARLQPVSSQRSCGLGDVDVVSVVLAASVGPQ